MSRQNDFHQRWRSLHSEDDSSHDPAHMYVVITTTIMIHFIDIAVSTMLKNFNILHKHVIIIIMITIITSIIKGNSPLRASGKRNNIIRDLSQTAENMHEKQHHQR